jgi:hypothetical protein
VVDSVEKLLSLFYDNLEGVNPVRRVLSNKFSGKTIKAVNSRARSIFSGRVFQHNRPVPVLAINVSNQ